MIDLRIARDDPDRVRASQHARGEDSGAVDRLLEADPAGRGGQGRLAARGAKAFGRTIGKAAKDERPALLERGKQMAAEVKEAEALEQEANAALTAAHMAVPNIIEGAPPGGEQDYLVIKEVGAHRLRLQPARPRRVG